MDFHVALLSGQSCHVSRSVATGKQLRLAAQKALGWVGIQMLMSAPNMGYSIFKGELNVICLEHGDSRTYVNLMGYNGEISG